MGKNSCLSILVECFEGDTADLKPNRKPDEKEVSYLDYCRTIFRLQQEIKNADVKKEDAEK